MLEDTLRENFGNRKETARKLNISTATLWRKMKKYGLIQSNRWHKQTAYDDFIGLLYYSILLESEYF